MPFPRSTHDLEAPTMRSSVAVTMTDRTGQRTGLETGEEGMHFGLLEWDRNGVRSLYGWSAHS